MTVAETPRQAYNRKMEELSYCFNELGNAIEEYLDHEFGDVAPDDIMEEAFIPVKEAGQKYIYARLSAMQALRAIKPPNADSRYRQELISDVHKAAEETALDNRGIQYAARRLVRDRNLRDWQLLGDLDIMRLARYIREGMGGNLKEDASQNTADLEAQ